MIWKGFIIEDRPLFIRYRANKERWGRPALAKPLPSVDRECASLVQFFSCLLVPATPAATREDVLDRVFLPVVLHEILIDLFDDFLHGKPAVERMLSQRRCGNESLTFVPDVFAVHLARRHFEPLDHQSVQMSPLVDIPLALRDRHVVPLIEAALLIAGFRVIPNTETCFLAPRLKIRSSNPWVSS